VNDLSSPAPHPERPAASRPKVSVVMACYNVARHLPVSIGSLFDQSLADWELLAVDDGSADDTLAVLHDYARRDPRIRVLAMERNSGPSAARNRALDSARGQWVTILDADDRFLPERLAYMVAAAEAGSFDLVFDDMLFHDEAANCITGNALTLAAPQEPLDFERFVMSERPHAPFNYGFLKPLIDRAFLETHHIRYSEDIRLAEDFMLDAELLLRGARAALLREAMYLYTTQTGASSGQQSSGTRTNFRPEIRIDLADTLIARYRDTADAAQMALLHRYRQWQVMYAHAHRLARYRHARDHGPMLRLALKHPGAAWHYMSCTRWGGLLRPRA
jgi:succinoglycan biosynthesis protein ExoO